MKRFIVFVCLLRCTFLFAGSLDSLLQLAIREQDPMKKCDRYFLYVNKLSRNHRDSASRLLIRFEDSCATMFPIGRYRAQSLRAYFMNFDSRHEESYKLLRDAMISQRKMDDTVGLALTLNRLGMVCSRFERDRDASRYLDQSLSIFTHLKDSERIDMVLNNIGVHHYQHKRFDEAIRNYFESLKIRLARKDYYWAGYSYFNIGSLYMEWKRLDSAEYCMDQARIAFTESIPGGDMPPMVYLGRADLFYRTQRYAQAHREVLIGLKGAEEINQTELLLEGKQLLAKILYSLKQYQAAYDTQQAFLELKFSVDSVNNAATVAELEEKYKSTEQALQIEQLSTQKLEAEQKIQRYFFWILIGVHIAIVLGLLLVWLWSRRNQRLRMEQAALNTRIAEAKMFALRAQMNPHFIFNSINTAQHFVINNKQEQAYEYLSDFAKLLRLVMENSAQTFVPLEDEIKQIQLYLELESIRFNRKFSYEILLDPQLESGVFEIPGMLIQPIIENAIGHGLINRNDDLGKLQIHFTLNGETIECVVRDNGVGRAKAAMIKEAKDVHYRSAAIPNIRERLATLSKETGLDVALRIHDLMEGETPSGTESILTIPYQ